MSHKIIFVDDDSMILELLENLFQNESYEVVVSDSPLIALEKIRSTDFSVIGSDYSMPNMNGAEFLREVKVIRPNAVRILFSGQATVLNLADAVNFGEVSRIVLKPWINDHLLWEIHRAIEQYEINVELSKLKKLTRKFAYFYQEITKVKDRIINLAEVEDQELATKLKDLFR